MAAGRAGPRGEGRAHRPSAAAALPARPRTAPAAAILAPRAARPGPPALRLRRSRGEGGVATAPPLGEREWEGLRERGVAFRGRGAWRAAGWAWFGGVGVA